MDINKIASELKEKYPEVGIRSIEMNEKDGTSTFFLEPTKKSLAFLEEPGKAITPRIYRDKAAVITRDAVDRTGLDLAIAKDAYDEAPLDSFKRATRYYYTEPIVGTSINLLAALACKGFELDIDDENIKNFYDTWAFDVGFEELLEWVFLDFFKIGHVTTYKVLAKYEPRVSTLSPAPGQKPKKVKAQIKAAKKNIWSKGHLPVNYTVLNPLLVNIEGNLLFDSVSVKLTPPPELTELLNKSTSDQTEDEKALIKALPSDLKNAAKAGGEYQLDSRLVGSITYRKQPYERYAKPRTARVFDSIEYKKSLRQADLSTLDGITNYILKITIGSDEYPVTTQAELEAVAQLFNTPSKSFDVVWNHTLQVEKIVSPEIASILGKQKYEQVNEDISGGLGVTRALIDGVSELSASEVNLVTKGLSEEIDYARRQVTRWAYKEFQQIAEAVGFDRFPKIRWDESVLKDTIMYMNTLSQLVDRRMLSYRTALESLNFDYPNELRNMEEEFDLVKKGVFGIVGSPWQQSKVQPTQGGPTGSPSAGRPKGKPAAKKKKETNPQKKTNIKSKPKKTASGVTILDVVKDMNPEQYADFLYNLENIRREEE